MQDFYSSAQSGNVRFTIGHALVTGCLWASGIAWSTAIRESILIVIPDDITDRVVAEFVAAIATTLLAVAIAILSLNLSNMCCFTLTLEDASSVTRRSPKREKKKKKRSRVE